MGVVMESKNGLMMKIEAVPVGWDGWAYLNTPKPKEDRPVPAGTRRDDYAHLDDEIPF